MSADVIAHGLLGEIMDAMKRIEQKVDALKTTAGGSDVATDRDLDGPHGDQVVRKDPKRWDVAKGSYVGCRWSECPPDYLDTLAGFKEWQAGMDDKKGDEDSKRKASFSRLDAKRMRGWAQRLRSGWKAPEGSATFPADTGGDPEIPF